MLIRSGLGVSSRRDAERALDAAQSLNRLIDDLTESWAQPSTDVAAPADAAVRELELVLAEAGARSPGDRCRGCEPAGSG